MEEAETGRVDKRTNLPPPEFSEDDPHLLRVVQFMEDLVLTKQNASVSEGSIDTASCQHRTKFEGTLLSWSSRQRRSYRSSSMSLLCDSNATSVLQFSRITEGLLKRRSNAGQDAHQNSAEQSTNTPPTTLKANGFAQRASEGGLQRSLRVEGRPRLQVILGSQRYKTSSKSNRRSANSDETQQQQCANDVTSPLTSSPCATSSSTWRGREPVVGSELQGQRNGGASTSDNPWFSVTAMPAPSHDGSAESHPPLLRKGSDAALRESVCKLLWSIPDEAIPEPAVVPDVSIHGSFPHGGHDLHSSFHS